MRTLPINLDDPTECEDFINAHGATKGIALANRLGIKGIGCASLATAFSNYAWNKKTAMACRLTGRIDTALTYENICDTIYARDIVPFCECW